MTEPLPAYQTSTPPVKFAFGTLTLEGVAAAFVNYASVRREALLRELLELERNLGYGSKEKPTTSTLRANWQRWRGRCPECGKELK